MSRTIKEETFEKTSRILLEDRKAIKEEAEPMDKVVQLDAIVRDTDESSCSPTLAVNPILEKDSNEYSMSAKTGAEIKHDYVTTNQSKQVEMSKVSTDTVMAQAQDENVKESLANNHIEVNQPQSPVDYTKNDSVQSSQSAMSAYSKNFKEEFPKEKEVVPVLKKALNECSSLTKTDVEDLEQMPMSTLMLLNPESIARMQYHRLREHSINVLKEITRLLENENYCEITDYLYKIGNDFGIEFGYDEHSVGTSIANVIGRLTILKTIANGESK